MACEARGTGGRPGGCAPWIALAATALLMGCARPQPPKVALTGARAPEVEAFLDPTRLRSCGAYYLARQALAEHPGATMAISPLPNPRDPSSMLAARAMVAAGPAAPALHDQLCLLPSAADPRSLPEIARWLDMDPAGLALAMARPGVEEALDAARRRAEGLGIEGAPGFVVQGRVVPPSRLGPALAGARDSWGEASEDETWGWALAMAQRPWTDPVEVLVDVEHRPALGPPDQEVTIFGFVDLGSPLYERAWRLVSKVVERGMARYVPRPMYIQGKPMARDLAEAGWFAYERGAFEEFHHRVLARRPGSREELEDLFVDMDMDPEELAAALDRGVYRERVQEDLVLAHRLGIEAQPAFVLGGRVLYGIPDLADLAVAVQREGEELSALERAGVSSRMERLAARARHIEPASRGAGARRHALGFVVVDPGLRYAFPVAQRPWLGDELGLVTVVLVMSYDDRSSMEAGRVMARLLAGYPEGLRVVVVHAPSPLSRQAELAARAALAAHVLGRFREYHEALLGGRATTREALVELAWSLGLDTKEFADRMDGPEVGRMLERDRADAARFGVRATPTSFVNGKYVMGFRSYAYMAGLVREELERAKALARATGGHPYRWLMEHGEQAARYVHPPVSPPRGSGSTP